MLRPAALLLAAVLAGPALWRAFVTGELATDTAVVRFLIAIPVAAAMLGVFRMVSDAYRPPAGPVVLARPLQPGDPVRVTADRLDQPADGGPAGTGQIERRGTP